MRYVYSLVRFVRSPARGEFLNVGAIAGSEEAGQWQIRQAQNSRLELNDDKALVALRHFWTRVSQDIDEHPDELSEAWLQQLHADSRNIVQLSAPIPMVASSAEAALDRVFASLVALDKRSGVMRMIAK